MELPARLGILHLGVMGPLLWVSGVHRQGQEVVGGGQLPKREYLKDGFTVPSRAGVLVRSSAGPVWKMAVLSVVIWLLLPFNFH